jgi:hypothetical protein
MESGMKNRLVVAAALACGLVLSAAPTSVAQGQEPPIAAKIKQLLGDTVRVNAVLIEDKTLNIAVNDQEVSPEEYVGVLSAACSAAGADAKQFKEIAIGNRFADQGYVFKAPGKCAEIAKMPADRKVDAILKDSEDL